MMHASLILCVLNYLAWHITILVAFSLAPDFKCVQKEISELIKGRMLIGHAIHHDLKVVDI